MQGIIFNKPSGYFQDSAPARRKTAGIAQDNHPHVVQWYDRLGRRLAVRCAIERLNALIAPA
ncbi:hypothetical protein [Sodalis sp. RH16]|uniref:hypothetical protein n=1 Tax=unclassified Sodalis (in: enterobacteria) TaxID=2636512 RepID=UPI0039B45081